MHNSLSKPKITAALAPRHRAPLPTHRQRTAHRICPVRPPQGRPTSSSWPRHHLLPHRSRRKRPTDHRPTPSRPVTDRAGTTAVPAGQPASWGPGTASGRRRCRAKPKNKPSRSAVPRGTFLPVLPVILLSHASTCSDLSRPCRWSPLPRTIGAPPGPTVVSLWTS